MFDDPSGAGTGLFSAPLSGFVPQGFVVAVPVKDEEERLPACLRASNNTRYPKRVPQPLI
jgi:hypothetical protein